MEKDFGWYIIILNGKGKLLLKHDFVLSTLKAVYH